MSAAMTHISSTDTPMRESASGGVDPRTQSKRKRGAVVERPGAAEGSWERSYFPPGNLPPERLNNEEPSPQQSSRVTVIPSSALFSWPLWISTEGEPADLVRLELSGRHFLKRGMESTLNMLPIRQQGGRQLVMAVATTEPFPSALMPAGWKESERFELPCRLFGTKHGHDLILWQEWGVLQMAFYRENIPVWFCSLRQQEAGGVLLRSALRLLSENVIAHLPKSVAIHGVSSGTADFCVRELQVVFPGVIVHAQDSSEKGQEHVSPQPLLPEAPFAILPTEAQTEQLRRKKLHGLLSYAALGAILYSLLLLWGAGDLMIRKSALKRLRREVASLEGQTLLAKNDSERWMAARQAVDPSTFPLDLLAATAAPTEGGKVRLTGFTLDHDRLQISGEATDVTQAYGFIEQLKKNPLLQEYNWSAGQPQLAGKNSVRFEMEGARATQK
jgi:hypothetical protein